MTWKKDWPRSPCFIFFMWMCWRVHVTKPSHFSEDKEIIPLGYICLCCWNVLPVWQGIEVNFKSSISFDNVKEEGEGRSCLCMEKADLLLLGEDTFSANENEKNENPRLCQSGSPKSLFEKLPGKQIKVCPEEKESIPQNLGLGSIPLFFSCTAREKYTSTEATYGQHDKNKYWILPFEFHFQQRKWELWFPLPEWI